MSQKNVTPMELNANGSVIEITVESVFLAFFGDHPLVAQECCELYGFVVPQFYSLPSVALFQLSNQVVIAVDIAALKSSV